MHDLGFDHLHPSEEEKRILSEIIWSSDNVELTTVGVDIGSSTSHLMFARVHLQRIAEGLSSAFVVVGRERLWDSPIILTPYRPDYSIDAAELATFIDEGYRSAGLSRDAVDSGAVILTGEALKRRNAREIADLFSAESGKFVCASAGHHLESLMAAHGSGAVALSRAHYKTVLNVDIGGGTTKLALSHGGKVLSTAAFAVGGRLIALDDAGVMTRIEGPAQTFGANAGIDLKLGQTLAPDHRHRLAAAMADVIVEVATDGPTSPLARSLMLTDPLVSSPRPDIITFSGGVSEYIFKREIDGHGDLGSDLADGIIEALEQRRLPWPVYDPGQGIRATVIGASQFSVQVSGNTILISDHDILPLRNVPVVPMDLDLSGSIDSSAISADLTASLTRFDMDDGASPIAVSFKWMGEPYHNRLYALAKGLSDGLEKQITAGQPIIFVMEGDIARALGRILVTELDVTNPIVSIDGIKLQELDYVDVGEMIRPTNVVPLVIKSLLFATPTTAR